MTIGEVGLELLKGVNARRLNALSMASSGVHNASQIHVYVFADLCGLTAHLIVYYLALFLTTTER
jgi:hypothetical protein